MLAGCMQAAVFPVLRLACAYHVQMAACASVLAPQILGVRKLMHVLPNFVPSLPAPAAFLFAGLLDSRASRILTARPATTAKWGFPTRASLPAQRAPGAMRQSRARPDSRAKRASKDARRQSGDRSCARVPQQPACC